MKVALYNLEPKIENTAMMQVSTYHKQKGDTVEIYSPFKEYDKIYAFSVFDYTDKSYVKKDMICGGSGFNLSTSLSKKIEECDFDWSLFPKCDHSKIWFSKGCIRDCPWCIVRKKDGLIHPVKIKNLNPNGTHIRVMDDNFFANCDKEKGCVYAVKKLKEWGQPVDFQGIDLRLLNKEKCRILNSFSHRKKIHVAWDDPKIDMIPYLKNVLKYIRPYKLMCYVLIGYKSSPEEDQYRVETLRNLKIDPFVMPFKKNDPYQKAYARYVNAK